MRLIIEKPVTVITPTIGQKYLKKCVDSVQLQTYGNIKHLLVTDGPECFDKVIIYNHSKIQIIATPENTGSNGFYGHRIYAAYPHLVNSDYIFFLDEDNWYEPDHVKSLVNLIEEKNFDWAYSLRNIYTKEGVFVDKDNCESLGRWPIYFTVEQQETKHLVDTSSYAFKREFLIQVCNHWHWGWGGDRRFFEILTKHFMHNNYGTTGLHTLNYRLDDNIEKKYGTIDFFKNGNEIMKKHYNGVYPWAT